MPPASAVNNNNAAMQAAAAERAERLRGSLKGFILADRQRRQEEYERQCEELRLRREFEAIERENNLALEETREQITKLDEQLAELHQKKHQLVVQLKKVLNDDETRKKQAKDNELFALQHAQALQQAVASVPGAQVWPVRLCTEQIPFIKTTGQSIPTTGSQPTSTTSVKRGRSPSPPKAYYKSPASYVQQQQRHDDYRRAAEYAKMSWNKPTTQYPTTGTLFYQTTAAPPTTTTQHQATDARIQPLYIPFRSTYSTELTAGTSATVSKAPGSQSPSSKGAMQVLHINLDQPAITQSDLVQIQAVQTSKPQVTMEKLPDRYHIEVKHDGAVPPPPHLLSESGVIYKPLLGELSLHPNVLQISTSPAHNPKATGSITQGYAPGRAATAFDQQLARQQLSLLPGQTSTGSGTAQSPHGQQLQYTRRLY